MKFLPLIWAGLWRKPARTLLTLLCVIIAFVLFGLLQGVDSAFTRIIGEQKLDRMFVDPRFGQPVPFSYKAQVQKVKGITKITEVHFMGAYYQDKKNGTGVIFTFALRVTPGLIAVSTMLALAIGALGALFPAVRAARRPVAAALRG